MAEIDTELLERAVRWCAEAGRQTTPAAVKAALGPLTWDELLAARAILADPPPLSPLGPLALADIARGAPADVAAERERGGRYGRAPEETVPPAGAAPRRTSPPRPSGGGRKKGRAPFVVRRASDRTETGTPPPRPLPLIDELLLDEGRAVLERLIRRHGGKRARIVAAIAAGWRRPDGSALDGSDLDRALTHHGMALAFENRERDELLHALRAAGGVRVRAAEALGLDKAGLDEALDRLGARNDAEKLREQRRRDLRARGTLTQRSHLLLDETERLADLGLLEEFSRDLGERLPDHVRALTAASPYPAGELLGTSLSLDPPGIERLLQYTGLKLDQLPARAPGSPVGAERRPPPRRPSSGGAKPRAGGARPPWRDRAGAGGRPGAGDRPPVGRTGDGGRPRGKPQGPRGERPEGRTGARPEGRSGGGRPQSRSGARPGGRPQGRPGARPGGRPGGRPGSGPRPPKRS
jgi:hypothetical protein